MAILSASHRLFAGLQLLSLGIAAVSGAVVTPRSIATDLQGLVRSSAVDVTLRQRWSDFEAPAPVVVVNATCESDIQAVVKYCNRNNVPLLPQNGGNGWAAFKNSNVKAPVGVVLNLAGLKQVKISADKKTATIGGGALISDVVAAADAAGTIVQTGNCNCVGALGAGLGGGYGNLIGEASMAVDNMLSLRVVTAKGEAIDVNPTTNPDLWWAMRGAGPNFGVVTSATYKAILTPDRHAWLMTLTFDGSRAAEVAQAVQDLPLLPNQVIFYILSNGGVMLSGFLRGGDEASGRKAFAPLYALGGVTGETSVISNYTQWNAPNDFFCARGGRKPAFGTALHSMNGSDWNSIFDLYNDFRQLPGAGNSAVLVERYNMTKAQSVGRGASAVPDELRFDSFAQAVAIPWYEDASLDAQALDFASKARDLMAGPAGGKANPG